MPQLGTASLSVVTRPAETVLCPLLSYLELALNTEGTYGKPSTLEKAEYRKKGKLGRVCES